MRLTANQVEHILERWHRSRRGGGVRFGSSDPTVLSSGARREVPAYAAIRTADVNSEVTPGNILQRIADLQQPDPTIDYEEQRRAGQFLNPPYVPKVVPPAIPKLRERIQRLQELRERNAQRRQRTIEDLASRSSITLTTTVAPDAPFAHAPSPAGLARPFQQHERPVESAHNAESSEA